MTSLSLPNSEIKTETLVLAASPAHKLPSSSLFSSALSANLGLVDSDKG
jgi:hypothetical protein